MAGTRSIRFRRARRKHREIELQLTSMLDVLVIILVFLLKSYSTSTNNFTTLPGLKLPLSASQDIPPDSLHLIITPEGMTFESVRIVEFDLGAGSLGATDADAQYSLKPVDLAEDGRQIKPSMKPWSRPRTAPSFCVRSPRLATHKEIPFRLTEFSPSRPTSACTTIRSARSCIRQRQRATRPSGCSRSSATAKDQDFRSSAGGTRPDWREQTRSSYKEALLHSWRPIRQGQRLRVPERLRSSQSRRFFGQTRPVS